MMRFAWHGAGALAPILAVLSAGAFTASTDDSQPDDSTTTDASDPDVDIEFQIDMLLGLVPDEEMEAYYADQYEARQVQIRDCMNEGGFEYALEARGGSVDAGRGDTSPVEWATQYGFGVWTQMDPERNPSGATEELEWANEEIVRALTSSEQNAWLLAVDNCQREANSNPDDPYRNPMVQQALADFNEDVSNDSRMRDAEEAWRDCMADAGQPYETQQSMYDDVYAVWNGDEELAELESQFYESEAWLEDSPDHSEWQALVDEEIAIAVADAECSPALEETRKEVQADLRPALVTVWQTIDWSTPPVTIFPDEGAEAVFVDGSLAPAADPSDTATSGSDDGPAPLDLSGGGDTEPADTGA